MARRCGARAPGDLGRPWSGARWRPGRDVGSRKPVRLRGDSRGTPHRAGLGSALRANRRVAYRPNDGRVAGIRIGKSFRPGVARSRVPCRAALAAVVCNHRRPPEHYGSARVGLGCTTFPRTDPRVKVFVAGASGTIGIPLVRALVDAGHHVVALTRSPGKCSALEALGASAVVADALDRDALVAAVSAAQPTHVIHQLTALPKEGPR